MEGEEGTPHIPLFSIQISFLMCLPTYYTLRVLTVM
jgi:hypothetical protein